MAVYAYPAFLLPAWTMPLFVALGCLGLGLIVWASGKESKRALTALGVLALVAGFIVSTDIFSNICDYWFFLECWL